MLHQHQIENFVNSSRTRLRLLWNVILSSEPEFRSCGPFFSPVNPNIEDMQAHMVDMNCAPGQKLWGGERPAQDGGAGPQPWGGVNIH